MAKQHYVMLAHKYNPKKHDIAGRFISEKLDGIRFLWDGGVSRGCLASEIPWANVTKDSRYREPPTATGLWTRYAKPIQAPDWFLDQFPWFPVDGELYADAGFQELSAITRSSVNVSNAWGCVTAWIFDAPPPAAFFRNRDISVPQMELSMRGCYEYWGEGGLPPTAGFRSRWSWLNKNFVEGENVKLLSQRKLSMNTTEAEGQLDEFLGQILNRGGEGAMIRTPSGLWEPQRSWGLLKYKPYFDAEGVVVGYIAGKGKHEGRMGSLILESHGTRFSISGFTDEERENAEEYFPCGSIVTYKYRGLTQSGKPKEARYWRIYD